MIWILFAIVTASVILAVARPLGRAAAPASGGASEVEAYKLQLADLDREIELGEIGKEEAAQTRTEISRRLLKASRQGAGTTAFSGPPIAFNTNIAFFALAAVIAIGAAGLYAIYGTPSLPDQPIEARLSAPPSEQPMAIQIANVERRLRQDPNDAAGWTVIAPIYFASGQFDRAAQAFRNAIKLAGPDEEKLLGLFEALAYGNEGTIPAEGKKLLTSALARNPKSLRGRVWLAVQVAQEGKRSEAEQIYRDMLGENPPPAWKDIIRRQLATLKEVPASQGSVQTSGDAAGSERNASIDAMVERLATRLKQNPADLNGWLMLVRSYTMLKEPAQAQEAIASARKQFASDTQALAQIDALLRELGSAPAASDVNASADAPADGQEAMIRGMVEKLATRLKENGADLDGWLRLIRSYSVLKDTAKTQEAATAARKQFESEPQALEKIEALTRELGLPPAAEGKAAASSADAPAADQAGTVDGMVAKLAARLKENGADLEGWLSLIRSYFVLNKSAQAQEAIVSARKQFASDPDALAQIDALLRELMPAAQGKTAAPAGALASKELASVDVMVERLVARLKENREDLNGWLMLIRSYSFLKETAKEQEAVASARKQFASNTQALEQIDTLLRELGSKPPEDKPAPPANAPQGKQLPAVNDMVERLAARLKANGADLNGWLMLIRSYSALKQPAKAQEAVASARTQFASEPKALEQIDALLREVSSAPAESNAAPSGNAPAEAEAQPAGGQEAMIRGMVERLATRLKENAADLDGWLRLIRSYTVMNEPAKAQEAAASARKQFASETQALEQIETLTKELGVPAADGKGE